MMYKMFLIYGKESMSSLNLIHKSGWMIYHILTLICAISNLLCLVNIQAWQLDLEGCWWRPLPRVQKRHMLRLPTHRRVLHRAVSVGWKPVNMDLLHPCKQKQRSARRPLSHTEPQRGWWHHMFTITDVHNERNAHRQQQSRGLLKELRLRRKTQIFSAALTLIAWQARFIFREHAVVPLNRE